MQIYVFLTVWFKSELSLFILSYYSKLFKLFDKGF